MTIFIFFLLVFVLFYIYFFYPLILCLKPVRRNTRIKEDESFSPSVSILVPAYNEEKYIEIKISNILEQDYPKECLEILIASDGSTDRTAQLAKAFTYPNLKVFEHQERRGKNSVLNDAEQQAKGEILVFTDINSFFVKDAIRKLIHHFQDPEVGLVCGHLKYLKSTEHNVGKGEGLYFKYEALIKRLESRWGTVAVVTGAIYAMRRNLFIPLDLDVANDFAHPVEVGAKGYKVLFEPEAIAYEQTTSSISEEFKRRVRITTRGFTAFGRYWKTYRILQGKRGFCFISHKLLRWFAPFFLIGLLISNLFLSSAVFKIILFAQMAFYFAAICGMFIKGRLGKLFVVPFYFCMINLAALIALINFIRGGRQSVWEVATTTR